MGRMQVTRYLCRKCRWYYRTQEGFAEHPCAAPVRQPASSPVIHRRPAASTRASLSPVMRSLLEQLGREADWAPLRVQAGRAIEGLKRRGLVMSRSNGRGSEYRITDAGREALAT